ncbi:hypothetical protein KVR01_006388 [Diaporthe batatas]|uniref:uncharacterized protein n=1 Tax=Diaporthe batatas TaxID=748121 RepID=UPI001D04AD08|nr:uncharacterized protein KVR01_006388 [Diaporthe batatas]KAG8164470.1 hypothetical protein KVR01_006388 [Diaporthe batatas]
MSASIRPISPPRPSSASVTATTVSSSSPPTTTSRSTVFPSGSSRGGGGGPSTTGPSSASSAAHPPHPHPHPHPHINNNNNNNNNNNHPVPAPPGVAAGTQAHEAQQTHPPAHAHAHPHHNPHQPHIPHPAQAHPHAQHRPPPPSSSSAAAAAAAGRAPASPTNPSHLPTEAEQEQIAQARTALVASIGNTLDHELQTRASLLHANQAAIEKQERDVERALADLRREDDRLLKVLNNGSRQVKELGDVQNWAERLERDFLVLEETMRLVHEGSGGSGSESGSWTGSESGSWSGSEGGSVVGDGDEDGDGDVRMADGDGDGDLDVERVGEDAAAKGKGKGKQLDEPPSTNAMDLDPTTQESSRTRPAGPEPNMLVDLVSASGPTPAPQQSPTSTGWLRRFWWRS